jgi:thymidylate kinase
LESRKIPSEIIFHPSPELKIILSDWRKSRQIDNIDEVYLLLADRYSRVKQLINPCLSSGRWIISLRSWVSALVYQGKTIDERHWINQEFKRFEPIPDILYYFDITPEQAMQRVELRHRKTGEAIGKFETKELLESKRKKYLEVLKDIRHIKLDAELSIADLHSVILETLVKTRRLQNRL